MTKRLLRKILLALTALIAILFVLEFVITGSPDAYQGVLGLLPHGMRQRYLDYVLDVRSGYFREYHHKDIVLEILVKDFKKNGAFGDYDGHQLIYLISGGMDNQEEPIPELAAYLLLLVNQRSNYEDLFKLYHGDAQTLEAFRLKLLQFGKLEPSRYAAVRDALSRVGGVPENFVEVISDGGTSNI